VNKHGSCISSSRVFEKNESTGKIIKCNKFIAKHGRSHE
jgi:hypothetical protein